MCLFKEFERVRVKGGGILSLLLWKEFTRGCSFYGKCIKEFDIDDKNSR